MVEAQSKADTVVIEAESLARSEQIKAEGSRQAAVLRAKGEAEGIHLVGEAASTKSGKDAMVQRLAEQYISELASMAKHSKMIIVPDRTNDVQGVLTTALGITNSLKNVMS